MTAQVEMAKPRVSGFTILAYSVFLLPALIVPAFVHEQMPMRGWVCFAWLITTPLACFIGNIGKQRTLKFYFGLAAVLVPLELVWYLASAARYAAPNPKTIAIVHIPLITIASAIFLPIGVYLTYRETRKG